MSSNRHSSNNGDIPPHRLSPGNINGFSALDAYWHMNRNAAANNLAFTGNANNGTGFSGPTYANGGGSTNIPFRPANGVNGTNGTNGNRQQSPLTPMRPAPRSPPFTHAGFGRGAPGPGPTNGINGYGRGGSSNGGGGAFMSGANGPRASHAYRDSPAAPFGVPGSYGRGGGGSSTQNGMTNGHTNGYTNGYGSDSSNGSPTRSPNGRGRGRGNGYGPYGPYGRGGGGVGGRQGGPSGGFSY
ncbi:hypothetical protein CSAL01_00323 [Colletotrichum salicis]|uniref:Uncharacterized protein n=1 Tax=Colletotrichum salicis TaxID=1209931 RepID=A0A135RTK3_9PEZI|nr:hypothetical protein CSAL01_00323 [Colletotrichum salicis]